MEQAAPHEVAWGDDREGASLEWPAALCVVAAWAAVCFAAKCRIGVAYGKVSLTIQYGVAGLCLATSALACASAALVLWVPVGGAALQSVGAMGVAYLTSWAVDRFTPLRGAWRLAAWAVSACLCAGVLAGGTGLWIWCAWCHVLASGAWLAVEARTWGRIAAIDAARVALDLCGLWAGAWGPARAWAAAAASVAWTLRAIDVMVGADRGAAFGRRPALLMGMVQVRSAIRAVEAACACACALLAPSGPAFVAMTLAMALIGFEEHTGGSVGEACTPYVDALVALVRRDPPKPRGRMARVVRRPHDERGAAATDAPPCDAPAQRD
jgi:hypothetical protein